jgi:hypothetical protein
MPRRKDVAEVAFGWLDLQVPPLTGVRGALEESLIPGTTVTRYNRTWHLGQRTYGDVSQRIILGRMGFESTDALNTVWDEERKDFVPSHPRLGQTSQFAIDVETLKVIFQLRGQTIRPWTFTTNFVALLREASGGYGWTFQLEGVSQPPWEEWITRVTRLTQLDVKMEFPNPRFNDQRIDELFTETKAAAVELVLKGEGIEIDSYDFIGHAIEHASNYGTYKAVGILDEAGEQHKDTWKLSLEGDARKAEVPQDPQTRDISPQALIAALESHSSEEELPSG